MSVYRLQIIEFIECVAELDRKIGQKAQSDFFIRKCRNLYYGFECFIVYSSMIFIVLTAFVFSFLPSLLAQELTIALPGVLFWGIHESPFIIIYFLGCVWCGSMIGCFDFLLGNTFNQFILHLEILNHEFLILGRESENTEKVDFD